MQTAEFEPLADSSRHLPGRGKLCATDAESFGFLREAATVRSAKSARGLDGADACRAIISLPSNVYELAKPSQRGADAYDMLVLANASRADANALYPIQ